MLLVCPSVLAPQYPDAEEMLAGPNITQQEIDKRINAQRRLAAYRSVIFWTYPDIKRRQRKPLPSCVYGMIRATYPSHEDEEIWADLQHTVYLDEPEDN